MTGSQAYTSLPMMMQFFIAHYNADVGNIRTSMDEGMIINPDFVRSVPDSQIEAVSPETIDTIGQTVSFTEESLFNANMNLQTWAFDLGNEALADDLNKAFSRYQERLAENDKLYDNPNGYLEALDNQTQLYKEFRN